MEAAGRIAPKDSDVRAAMTKLHGLVGGKSSVAQVTDHLASVPNGTALGELVLGLATLAKSDSSDDPIVDRILLRDRAILRAIDTPMAARRLLARVLLEEGRSVEAQDRLNAILRNGTDPEASWLLSRVYLQQGQDEDASRALENAKGFGRDHGNVAEPAPYVGARACRECHSSIFKDQQNSRHATTIHHGEPMTKIPLPAGPVVDPADPKVSHTFTREGNAVRVETSVADRHYRALMDYALGSGHRGMTLVGKDDEGSYRELRISHYSERGSIWDITSGFSPHPSDPSEFLGKGISPAGFRDCLHCHTTRFRSPESHTGPEAADRGIGCERCHGPGGNHVAAMKRGFDDLAIGRYKQATGPQRMTACAGCHASDGTFPPTDPQFVRFQSTTLPFSKCYTATSGKFDCMTCHDPHKTLESSAVAYENKCLDCHGTKAAKTEPTFRRVACPVNPSRDCLKCHMPTVENVVPHTSFTDHHIRVHRSEESR